MLQGCGKHLVFQREEPSVDLGFCRLGLDAGQSQALSKLSWVTYLFSSLGLSLLAYPSKFSFKAYESLGLLERIVKGHHGDLKCPGARPHSPMTVSTAFLLS